MNINQIHYNRINTHISEITQTKIANRPSFGNSVSDDTDTFDIFEIGKGMSSAALYIMLKRGEYKLALHHINNYIYNPNFTHERSENKSETLLESIYSPIGFGKIKSLFHKKLRNMIANSIVQHPDFSIEDTDTDYLKFAIENDDAFLVSQLGARFGKKLDKTGFEFEDYKLLTKNEKIINLLNKLSKIEIAKEKDISGKTQTKSEKVFSTDANEEGESLFEESIAKQYRVEIQDTIPSSLSEIGGLDKAKTEIEDFIIKPWSKDIRCQLKDNNVDMPNGFLMSGPPGCGKTFVVKVIAKETGYPMYEVDLSNIGNSAAYATEKALRALFEALESQYKKNNVPNILFLDEIDSIAASRKKTGTDWKRDEINCLIKLINNVSDKGIILIGATNNLDYVDEAVLRTGRFDKKIEIALPTEKEREDILKKMIYRKKIAISLLPIVKKLAKITDGKNCSDLAAILNACCRKAIYKGKTDLTEEDFINALRNFQKEETPKKLIGFND